jgi:1-phosphofructokinase family hexose kinase
MLLVVGLSPAFQRVLYLDELHVGRVTRATGSSLSTGGKALNVARALTSLGAETCLLQVLGGPAGHAVAKALDRAGIRHETLFTSDGTETRTCTTLIEAGGRVTELVEECPRLAPALLLEVERSLERLLATTTVLCLSGSLPPGVSARWYADQVAAARARGLQSLVDVQGRPLREALGERPFLVKPNLEETQATLGLPASGDAAADARVAVAALTSAGAEWALVSMRRRGAILGQREGRRFSLSPPPVQVKNPIGAGDTLAAGLLFCLSRGDSVPEAARFGTACAAASCLTDAPAFLNVEAASRLTAEVGLEPIPS